VSEMTLFAMSWFLNGTRYSPTAYNVFTAYTIRSKFVSEGSCVTVTNAPSTLASAYSQPITESSGKIYLNGEGQQDFIEYLGFTSCSGGGEHVIQNMILHVQNITTEITRYQTGAVLAPISRTLGPVSLPVFLVEYYPFSLSSMIHFPCRV
jgi:hypothetical protein